MTLPLWPEAREVSESQPYYDDFILCFWGKGVGMHRAGSQEREVPTTWSDAISQGYLRPYL